MNLFSYVITRDYGFAPNPYFNICTLATCKPKIRKNAIVNDLVCGFAGKGSGLGGKLVYLMQVSDKMTFDEYWDNSYYKIKRPIFTQSKKFCYGDNIYHRDKQSGIWIQENSHHSEENNTNYYNLNRDTNTTDMVLLSNTYWYFGSNAITIPDTYKKIIHSHIGYKKISDENLINNFLIWLDSNYSKGINGIPFSWLISNVFERYDGKS